MVGREVSRFHDHYKRGVSKGVVAERQKRAEKKLVDRRVSRIQEFSKQRNLSVVNDDSVNTLLADPRKLKLAKWKEQKQQQKLKNMGKPAFIVGVVRHHVGSPFLRDVSNTNHKSNKKQVSKPRQKVDANSSIKSFAPSNFKFKPPVIKTFSENTSNPLRTKIPIKIPGTPGIVKKEDANPFRRVTRAQTRANQIRTPSQQNKQPSRKPMKNIKKEIPGPVQQRDNSKLETPLDEIINTLPLAVTPEPLEEVPCFPIQFSPFVTKERGSSGRRSRMLGTIAEESVALTSSAREKLDFEDEDTNKVEDTQERGVQCFKSLVDSQTERLQNLCEEWLNIQQSAPNLPLEASDLINVAVGQTQLLINKKFSQFRGLIDRCERSSELETTEAPVTCTDLDGFWEMMYIQVEDVGLRFNNLQKMKFNNWTEEVDVAPVLVKGSKRQKKVQRNVQSSLRAVIAAARKKQQPVDTPQTDENVTTNLVNTPEQVASSIDNVTPSIHQPRKSILEYKRHSYTRSRESSPIIMKVTRMAKLLDTPPSVKQVSESSYSLTTQGTPLPKQTPRKSILKSVPAVAPESVNTTLCFEDDVDDLSACEIETKENKPSRPRRSSRQSTARKVRFEGTCDNSPKPVHPMTPFISHIQKPKQRDSLRVSLLGIPDDISCGTPLATGDLISFDSPASEPRRVTRRSARLSIQTR